VTDHDQNTPTPTLTPSGQATERGNAAPPTEVGAMFDRISGVYDVMNLVISGFQEPRWRHRAVRAAGVGVGDAVIDVATGTGKVAASLKDKVGPAGRVLGVDLAPRMIQRAKRAYADRAGLEFVVGNAMDLPAEDGAFDAATIAFGMRNLPDYGRGFAEMGRVVRPGGRVVCLEIARPDHLIARIGRVWFERIVPFLGRVAGQGDAYGYLVESVRNYPDPDSIAGVMRAAGLVDVAWTPMTFGMVTVHVGRRPTDATGPDGAGPDGDAPASAGAT
jgi:demethylmenaquinone methyltransferase/2-methoxy-6-polyprenyl-1,4-benzoquinol methylase